MDYFRPLELDQALVFLAAAPAQVLAGGTDVYPALGARPMPKRVLDLTALAALKGITRDRRGWRIGAATTWAEILQADLPPAFDGLKAAARQVGSLQIQTTATVAGNLCNASPAADGVPVLLTLDAEVEIAAPDGCRRVPLAGFILGPRRTALGPKEIVTAVHVPLRQGDACAGFTKLGARRYLVISIASVAAWLRFDGDRVAEARVAVGACSPVPMRLPAFEAALVGRPRAGLAAVARAEHFSPLCPIDDVRATAGYRIDAVRTLAARLVQGLGIEGEPR